MSRTDPSHLGLSIPPEPTYAPGELMHALAHEPPRKGPGKAPTGYRKACFERDEWRCRHCGCENRALLTVHHVQKREHGGSHALDNLLTLCLSCHRAVHQLEHQ